MPDSSPNFADASRRPLAVVPCSFGSRAVARRTWRKGDIISVLDWDETEPVPNRWTLQRGEGLHAEPRPIDLRYVNHSCDPNAHFDVDGGTMRALRDIADGEELTAFYPATEWDMAEPFECVCAAASCLGRISGAVAIPAAVLRRYALSQYVADALARRERE